MPDCVGGRTPDCVVYDGERGVDLENIGVSSDSAFFGAESAFLHFGISTHGTFTTPAAFTNYNVFIDATGDGEWDYQLLTTRFTDRADPLDVPIVIGADRDGNLLPSNEAPAISS